MQFFLLAFSLHMIVHGSIKTNAVGEVEGAAQQRGRGVRHAPYGLQDDAQQRGRDILVACNKAAASFFSRDRNVASPLCELAEGLALYNDIELRNFCGNSPGTSGDGLWLRYDVDDRQMGLLLVEQVENCLRMTVPRAESTNMICSVSLRKLSKFKVPEALPVAQAAFLDMERRICRSDYGIMSAHARQQQSA